MNYPFWSADFQVTSLERAMKERDLNMKKVLEKKPIGVHDLLNNIFYKNNKYHE